MNKSLSLSCVVTGFPGGGTSMLTQVLRQQGQLDSGFEGGFLLKSSPSEFRGFNPYYANLLKLWDVTEEDLDYIIDTEDWYEMYDRLRERSKKIDDKNVALFDKTPKYMTKLTSVLQKVPYSKCVVILRDPRSVFWTRVKRTKHNHGKLFSKQEWIEKDYDGAISAYTKHARGYMKALRVIGEERILTVQYEALCQNTEREAERIFNFLGLDYQGDEIRFDGKDERYRPIKGDGVSTDFLFEYKSHLTGEVIERIHKDLNEFGELFWVHPE